MQIFDRIAQVVTLGLLTFNVMFIASEHRKNIAKDGTPTEVVISVQTPVIPLDAAARDALAAFVKSIWKDGAVGLWSCAYDKPECQALVGQELRTVKITEGQVKALLEVSKTFLNAARFDRTSTLACELNDKKVCQLTGAVKRPIKDLAAGAQVLDVIRG